MNKPLTRFIRLLFVLGPLVCFLSGCGQTGPLTLPQPEKIKDNEPL
jgi:predicted small lipoprotein YifL